MKLCIYIIKCGHAKGEAHFCDSSVVTCSKVVIILKAMAFLNLSTKNSNRGRENYLPMIRSRSVNKFLFSVTYEAH